MRTPTDRARDWAARVGRRLAAADVDQRSATAPVDAVNDRYIETAPSPANAVDLFAGQWSTKLPIDAPTGDVDLFGDSRVIDYVQSVGGVDGQRVLELGPLEGAHTATLRNDLGAAHVTAIEANTSAYLRCLITKELIGLDGVEFQLGDFRPYLATTDDRFDLAVAIGVLYHLDDPVPVLADLTRIADRIVLWTHVHADERNAPQLADRFDAPIDKDLNGTPYRLHPYRYESSLDWSGFCGGTRPKAAWIERDSLLTIIASLGLVIERIEETNHPHGPTVTMALRKRPPFDP
ncbi:MAG: class I SAM-dependent methyltransferase [Ilumatobacteraceae bacterium]|nr:class I SAM-dependent methyltransferase [Ilumatobacteraceae bacterium]